MDCNDDYECKIDHFCWYWNKADAKRGQKKCMEMYSAELYVDFGWAFTDPKKNYTLEDYT